MYVILWDEYNLTVMSFEEKQILKLSKQLSVREEEYKRQRGMLLQKVELLQLQVGEYQQKQMKNRQLNESIMMSYRQNESFREQHTQQEMSIMGIKHQDEIKKIKQRHSEVKNNLEEELNTVKAQNDKLRIDAERTALQFEKKIAEVRREYEDKLCSQGDDLNFINQRKLDLMGERLLQTEKMNIFYKQQLENKKSRNHQGRQFEGGFQYEQQNGQNEEHYGPDVKSKKAGKAVLPKREELSTLNLRINRALTQLNPNRLRLQQKIRQIKNKQY